ncbi:hypothetical protein VTK56DRAFT_5869 [Thermocarpiscus australiensis]
MKPGAESDARFAHGLRMYKYSPQSCQFCGFFRKLMWLCVCGGIDNNTKGGVGTIIRQLTIRLRIPLAR